MYKKFLLSTLIVVLLVSILTAAYSITISDAQKPTQQEIAFSVTGTNTCLRFLDRNVSTCYMPFTTAANEKWQL